jgi:hypothetical protein
LRPRNCARMKQRSGTERMACSSLHGLMGERPQAMSHGLEVQIL